MRAIKSTVLPGVSLAFLWALASVADADVTPPPPPRDLTPLVTTACRSDPMADRTAIDALRAEGLRGLEALLVRADATSDPKLKAVIDAVAAQKDASFSRLYWYTDLERAKAAAREQGKPILSLRLLGNLDSDLSCANSRFFRTALYANADVSKLLRERFILHWQSVRPAPRITIDFGDGRKIERTITGNSVHYVLSPAGQIVDALPGMYGPAAFKRILDETYEIANRAELDPAAVRAYQARARAAIMDGLSTDVARTGVRIDPAVARGDAAGARPARPGAGPRADVAAPRAVSKVAVQAPMVRAVLPRTRDMGAVITESGWNAVAALHAQDARLDAASVALIRAKRPDADEGSIGRMVASFERSMALDTVRNEYLFRAKVLQWLASGAGGNLNALNERVYAELFLTPASDPWLGLAPADTYSGLENDGLSGPAR